MALTHIVRRYRMVEIWVIFRKVVGQQNVLQVLKDGCSGWAMVSIGSQAGSNAHLDVRLFYTEKERDATLKRAGATFRGNNRPSVMTLAELIKQTAPEKKEKQEKQEAKAS